MTIITAMLWKSPNSKIPWVAHRTTYMYQCMVENCVAWIIFVCPNYFDLSMFFVINTEFACFLFNLVPTFRELGGPYCPSGDFEGHVGSHDRVMGRIWRLGDLLSTALITWVQVTASRRTYVQATIVKTHLWPVFTKSHMPIRHCWLHCEADTKWPLFSRRHFPTH